MRISKRKLIYTGVILVGFFVLFFSAKESSYGRDFVEAESEHYRITPDVEMSWYELSSTYRDEITGAVDFYSPLIIEDTGGGRTLMTRYEDTAAYIPVRVDEELLSLLGEAIGVEADFAESADDFELIRDEKTGLFYMRRCHAVYEDCHVLLTSQRDVEVFENLADEYALAYPEVFPDASVGRIYAEYEIYGHAWRFQEGFLFYQPGGITYIDVKDTDRHWDLALTYDEYTALSDYMARGVTDFDMQSFDAWTDIFDEAGVEYDIKPDPDSKRYQAARAHLTSVWGSYPAPGMSEEMAEHNLKNEMKSFDEDGYRLNIYGIAGMDATDMPAEERMVILAVPEEVLRRLYDYERQSLVKWYGIHRDADEKSEIFFDYQRSAPVEERLRGTYTLEQYDRAFLRIFINNIRSYDSDWKPGEPFEPEIFDALDFEEVMSRISSDGTGLSIDMDPGLHRALDDASREMVEWMLR